MCWWSERAYTMSLISRAEQRALHVLADTLATIPIERTTCHLDYQPPNWILRPDHHISVVDFEHTRPDARIRDLTRLAHRHWNRDPRLREVFLAGYGHPPNTAEADLLDRFAVLDALTALVRGHESADLNLIEHGRTLHTHLHRAQRRSS
jgi:thiamine kinase-like enzyme